MVPLAPAVATLVAKATAVTPKRSRKDESDDSDDEVVQPVTRSKGVKKQTIIVPEVVVQGIPTPYHQLLSPPGLVVAYWKDQKKKNMVTCVFPTLAGQNSHLLVVNEGMTLLVMMSPPCVMFEDQLKGLFADVPDNRRDMDFYSKLQAVEDATKEERSNWRLVEMEGYHWSFAIHLKFACEKETDYDPHKALGGARLLRVTLKEKGSDEDKGAIIFWD